MEENNYYLKFNLEKGCSFVDLIKITREEECNRFIVSNSLEELKRMAEHIISFNFEMIDYATIYHNRNIVSKIYKDFNIVNNLKRIYKFKWRDYEPIQLSHTTEYILNKYYPTYYSFPFGKAFVLFKDAFIDVGIARNLYEFDFEKALEATMPINDNNKWIGYNGYEEDYMLDRFITWLGAYITKGFNVNVNFNAKRCDTYFKTMNEIYPDSNRVGEYGMFLEELQRNNRDISLCGDFKKKFNYFTEEFPLSDISKLLILFTYSPDIACKVKDINDLWEKFSKVPPKFVYDCGKKYVWFWRYRGYLLLLDNLDPILKRIFNLN